MTVFTEKVIQIILSIPEGKVMTYGQIAALAEGPRAARQVVRILHSMSRKHSLQWHRVINSKGEISLKGEGFLQQKHLLEREGVEVGAKGSIDLKKFLWRF